MFFLFISRHTYGKREEQPDMHHPVCICAFPSHQPLHGLVKGSDLEYISYSGIVGYLNNLKRQ